MTTIGVIGIENSHVDHFVRHLNVEDRHPGITITTLVGGEPDRQAKLQEAGNGLITTLANDPQELIGAVDAAIICSRDGALHAAQALPLLEAGMPVLVDKPLAITVADAQAMIDAKNASGALLLSTSALRAVPEMADLRAATEQRGTTCTVTVTGPADPHSEYSGLAFYGIHEVEAALEICGNATFGPIEVRRVDGCITATTVIGAVIATINFVTKDDLGQIGFFASVAGRHGITQTPLTLGPNYNAPMLDLFVDMIKTQQAPISDEVMLRPIQLLEAIMTAL